MRNIIVYIVSIFLAHSASVCQIEGTLRELNFIGQRSGQAISFSIYLPPDYETSDKSYPVVYNLHGLGDNYRSNSILPIINSFEHSASLGFLPEMIIVFPDGYENSMWSDSFDSLKLAETNIIEEIIPLVDARYRTNPIKQHRFVQGFSMGGYGAAKLIAKYPELFCKAVSYDGGMRTWRDLKRGRPQIADEIFNDDESLFHRNSPWYFIEKNQAALSLDTVFYITIGYFESFNKQFLDSLYFNKVPYHSTFSYCQHDFLCHLEREWLDVAIFYSECLAPIDDLNVRIINNFGISPAKTKENNLSINYSTERLGKITLKITDRSGSTISTLVNTYKLAGNYRLDLSLSRLSLPKGSYFVELAAPSGVLLKKQFQIR